MLRKRHTIGLILVGCLLLVLIAMRSGMSLPRLLGFPVASAQHPVVVELFDSQGCAQCPPAEMALNELADRQDILPLSFAVTYWDRFGWKDPFGSDRFTSRQVAYLDAGKGRLATPEFVVNGSRSVIGAIRRSLDEAIDQAEPARDGPAISADRAYVRVAAAPAEGSAATVWLVRYDPRTIRTPVGSGENSGRTLVQRNVVRELTDMGRWTGETTLFALPAPHEPGLATAVLVQRGPGGRIISARKIL